MRCVLLSLTLANVGLEAIPHNKLWGIGLSACDQRVSSPDTRCGLNLLCQALEHTRETLAQETIALLYNPILPETSVSMHHTSDAVFEIDSVNHIHLDMAPNPAYAHTATLSAFTDLAPDDLPQGYFWPTHNVLMCYRLCPPSWNNNSVDFSLNNSVNKHAQPHSALWYFSP